MRLEPTPEMIRFVQNIVDFDDARDFSSLDEIHQDQFAALYLKAFNDTEIVIGSDGNHHLAKLLLTHDQDSQYELLKTIRESLLEKVEPIFDELIADELAERKNDDMYAHGLHKQIDKTNGEVRWIR